MDLILTVEDNALWAPGKRKIKQLGRVPDGFKLRLLKMFTSYMASVYVTELVIAIDTQRYWDVWEPLNERYLEFKKAMGWSENTWERTSLLKESITWWSVGKKGYAVGINKKAVYKLENGETLPVRLVAQWMEYGTGEQAERGNGKQGHKGMPPRPLFRPLRERLSRDIHRWYSKFIDEYAEDIDDILVYSTLEDLA